MPKPRVVFILDEKEARAIHNALSRYHLLLTKEHAESECNPIPNFQYRQLVQQTADRIRDEVIAIFNS